MLIFLNEGCRLSSADYFSVAVKNMEKWFVIHFVLLLVKGIFMS